MDAEDESFAAVLFESSSICRRGAMLYPHVGELTVSFNGGKDACVVPWLSFFPNSFGVFSIVKVSGQNCFRTLYGSLGQIGLGPPKGSAEGSTKVPPRFHQWCLWFSGQIRLGLPKGSVLKGSVEGSPRFHQGFTEVSPRLRKFPDLSGLLGQIRFGVPTGSVERSPITSLNLSPSSSTLFCIFPKQR